MSRPFGTECGISPYHWTGEGLGPEVGDYLFTPAGSWYLIVQARSVAGNPRRFAFRCIRTAPAEVDRNARHFCLRWFKRNRKKLPHVG